MGGVRQAAPLGLDLQSFDPAEAENSRLVFLCRRSQESRDVKPVQLLIKSLNELIAERRHRVPCEAVRVMHESYEKERSKSLKTGKEEEERIIQIAAQRPGRKTGSRLEMLPELKKNPKLSQSDARDPVPYANLCSKGKCGSRSSCCAAGGRDPERRSSVCSFGPRFLKQSADVEAKVRRITESIRKEMSVTVSETDQKIAALMLLKHQEEQERLKLCHQKEEERQEAWKQEQAQRAQAEKTRRKKLLQSLQRWHEEVEARKMLRKHLEKELATLRAQEVLLQEGRWRRLREEMEAQRTETIKAAHAEAKAHKRKQEKLLRDKVEVEKRIREKERQMALEREGKAVRSKVLLEEEVKKKLQLKNHKELLHHSLLKRHLEEQMEAEQARVRSTLENKMRRSCEKRAEAVEARLRELQERASREEARIEKAQKMAELQSHQRLTHKQLLVQLSQSRSERACKHATAQWRSRAEKTHQSNNNRRLCHQRMRESIQREEEAAAETREGQVALKKWRMKRLQRQKEQIQEEAHRQARASFHMRDKVRQQTRCRTFEQMALEASVSQIKL
ncbi:coiled-coil domain-containing protein 177 [Thalassophryne amazonica]|uniref:coiled-coil domain-containing protein 177 n=1 Tax=Thalassophryne amazonica TaxID=390379 RepID=UPI001470B798|nr:coiled-coil domain-containing protein 177 [Thalassophryne amazonica]